MRPTDYAAPPQPGPHPPKRPTVSAERGALLSTLVNLWPYLWPSDRADLKRRVLYALALLLIAKLVTLAVPFTFKWATDALDHPTPPRADHWLALAAGGAAGADADLRAGAHPDGAAHAMARRACSPRSPCTRCGGWR